MRSRREENVGVGVGHIDPSYIPYINLFMNWDIEHKFNVAQSIEQKKHH